MRFGSSTEQKHGGPIRAVLLRYYPDWEEPEYKDGWISCLCPSHVEERPSAAVNFDRGAVKCQACGFSGDAYSIIRDKEGCTFSEAQRIAGELSPGSQQDIQRTVRSKPSSRVFGAASGDIPGDRKDHGAGVRRGFRS